MPDFPALLICYHHRYEEEISARSGSVSVRRSLPPGSSADARNPQGQAGEKVTCTKRPELLERGGARRKPGEPNEENC